MSNKATANELITKLAEKSTQLDAMLTIITGEGYKPFTSWNEDTQGEYIWACSSMSQCVAELARELANLDT